jgi:hypothetical protein
MNKSFAKIRHIQESNAILEKRILLNERTATGSSTPQSAVGVRPEQNTNMKKVEVWFDCVNFSIGGIKVTDTLLIEKVIKKFCNSGNTTATPPAPAAATPPAPTPPAPAAGTPTSSTTTTTTLR